MVSKAVSSDGAQPPWQPRSSGGGESNGSGETGSRQSYLPKTEGDSHHSNVEQQEQEQQPPHATLSHQEQEPGTVLLPQRISAMAKCGPSETTVAVCDSSDTVEDLTQRITQADRKIELLLREIELQNRNISKQLEIREMLSRHYNFSTGRYRFSP